MDPRQIARLADEAKPKPLDQERALPVDPEVEAKFLKLVEEKAHQNKPIPRRKTD